MHDVSDYELEKTEPPPDGNAPKPRSLAPWIAGGLILLGGAALYYYQSRQPAAPAPSSTVAQTDVPVGAPEPVLGAEAKPVDVPALDETDTLVRELVRGLSSHPRVAAWLTTNGLIRNFVVSVENIARGQTPSVHLGTLRPKAPFAVIGGRGALMIDTRSYSRYNDLAVAVDSVNAEGAAMLYTTLKPRIEEAYRELGYDTPFDRALTTAIVRLLEAPAADGEIALISRGALYQFNDPRLERLTAAQKQLVRMGPRNTRTIQRKLHAIALALGIPPERLPRTSR
jgi:hypothetical protein